MHTGLNQILSSVRHVVSAIATGAVVTLSFPASAEVSNHLDVVAIEQQVSTQLRTTTEDELKGAYSDCSREAMRRGLGSGEAALCSIVYETLLTRVFGGDFEA